MLEAFLVVIPTFMATLNNGCISVSGSSLAIIWSVAQGAFEQNVLVKPSIFVIYSQSAGVEN
jgi:hypothetical protein